MDIIKLLAGEQRALLHARFGTAATRARHVTEAISLGDRLRGTSYPHRNVARIAVA